MSKPHESRILQLTPSKDFILLYFMSSTKNIKRLPRFYCLSVFLSLFRLKSHHCNTFAINDLKVAHMNRIFAHFSSGAFCQFPFHIAHIMYKFFCKQIRYISYVTIFYVPFHIFGFSFSFPYECVYIFVYLYVLGISSSTA
jgi:hypothetical protein